MQNTITRQQVVDTLVDNGIELTEEQKTAFLTDQKGLSTFYMELIPAITDLKTVKQSSEDANACPVDPMEGLVCDSCQ